MSKSLILESKSLEDLPQIATKISDFAGENKIWLLEGEMGAGKTTLSHAICDSLGISSHFSSPTYSIVNEYITNTQKTIYHFDFYRIRTLEEAYDMGAEEYFYSGNLCLIEWPSKIESLIPEKFLKIDIRLAESDHRIIELTNYE
jgi:tRNA threonylcarbamoyladenosine biosynthesis protein TsaE